MIAAVFVLIYILLGGLRATMYNEVLQFALIVIGFAPLAWYSVRYCWGNRRISGPACTRWIPMGPRWMAWGSSLASVSC